MDLQEAFDAGFEAVKTYVERSFDAFEVRLNEVERRFGELPTPKDGKSITAEDVAPLISEHVSKAVADAVSAIPPARDGDPGKSVDMSALDVMVSKHVEDVVAKAVSKIPAPQNGKDADPELISVLVSERVSAAVESAVADIPVPQDGKSLTAEDVAPLIAAEVEKAVSAIPLPKDGKSIDEDEVAALVERHVADAVSEIPKPADGKDADPAFVEELVDEKVSKAIAALPLPKDGLSVTAEDVRPLIEDAVTRAVSAIPVAKDGVGLAGAIIDRSGSLVVTLSDGSARELGQVVGKDADMRSIEEKIVAEVKKIPVPKDGVDGADGLGFDDMEVVEDEDGIKLRFVRGDVVKDFRIPVPIDNGVWREKTFLKGSGVSWGGSFWIAQKDTDKKPDTENSGWRLAVKRGRDGKESVTILREKDKPVKA